jgi:hypothetical protein
MKWNGESYFSIPYKLNNGLTRLGHDVFSVCDRDLADSYFLGMRELGRGYANKKLQQICEQVRPDILLLGHCTLISAATVSSIRKIVPGVRIAHWNCDPLFYPEIMNRLRELAPIADATFVTTAGPLMQSIADAGGRVTFMPNPVDKSIETPRAFENGGNDIDLLFIGSPIKETERAIICETIRRDIPELKFETRGFAGAPPVFGAGLFDLMARSGMGLSLNRREDVFLYASDRMSIMMGCGLLTFVDKRTGFDSIFGANECVCFEGTEDLLSRLRYFMGHDEQRRAIAQGGWRKIHEIFSETRVAKWIVETTLGDPPSEPYAWPTEVHGKKASPRGRMTFESNPLTS